MDLKTVENFISKLDFKDTENETTTIGLITEGNMDIKALLDANKNKLELVHMSYSARYNLARYLDKGIKEVEGDVYFFANPEKPLSKDALNIDWFNLPYEVNIFDSNYKTKELILGELLEGELNYDAIICKSSFKEKFNYWFESYYAPVEKYRFCINAYLHDVSVGTVDCNLLEDSSYSYVGKFYVQKMKKIFYSPADGDFTCVISFINEGDELERTVSSIRYTANNVRIILVDDCSDDGYPYSAVAKNYNCEYYRATERLGSAGGKNYGASLVETKYFSFFDCHMRLYNENWDLELISYLEDNPNSIIAPRTIYMNLDDDGFINNEDGYDGTGRKGHSACCSVTFQPSYEFDPKWCDIFADNDKSKPLSPVACVLGAVYAMETGWWKNIHGFDGLQIYGLEETLISLKTFLMGGTCYVIKNWGVGHLYRKHNSAPINPRFVDANRIFLTHLFRDDKYKEYKATLSKRIGPDRYAESERIYKKNEALMLKEYDYLESKRVRTIDEFIEFDKTVSNKEHLQYVK